jgi:hypothetical protein
MCQNKSKRNHVYEQNGIQDEQTANRLRKIHLLFAHCANGSFSFVHLLMKKQLEVIRLQTVLTD